MCTATIYCLFDISLFFSLSLTIATTRLGSFECQAFIIAASRPTWPYNTFQLFNQLHKWVDGYTTETAYRRRRRPPSFSSLLPTDDDDSMNHIIFTLSLSISRLYIYIYIYIPGTPACVILCGGSASGVYRMHRHSPRDLIIFNKPANVNNPRQLDIGF